MATQATAVELVVLLASAGGLDALSVVLHDLLPEFPAAVVVQQHLGGSASVLPTILARSTEHRVDWASDGEPLEPGQVIVCPPEMHMELEADGSCRLHKVRERGDRPFDALLTSVARSYGARGLAVVLSGSGRDGAEGTAAMKRVGAIVIAQSPDTADYPSMPMAAAEAGADLVLPIHEIGAVLADVVGGAPLPRRGGSGSGSDRVDHAAETSQESDPTPSSETRQPPNSPAARAETARLRATELRRRREELAAGLGPSAETVAVARRRVQESLRRAQLAHQAASRAAAEWGR
ncbi:hypothetical protein A5747_11925 [Mycobacterium sp. IS-836]|uniref:chemotaxis protein CheB n=1 Tax=Mycobacterium sp. IS-836 TaxID=1834160 RepID=UPI00096D2EC6|nr:chemotaxis protein CheB [Mycobacterium sp. IS-836]OMC55673.1 hypothetical protein A5747_11925 [Mycobacterium sp. IS-836]